MKSRPLGVLSCGRRIALVAAGLLVLSIPLAAAAVSVRLISGMTTVTCDDGDPSCDLNPAAGVVAFSGSVGPFTINVTTAITEPALGSASFAILDLNSVNVSGGAGSLTILASHTGYTGPLPGGFYPAQLNVGGTTTGTVSFAGYLDDGNALFGTTSLLGALGPFGPGAFSGSVAGAAPATAPFSLTLVAEITHRVAGITSFDFEVRPRVAEPGMLSLFGIGLGSVLVGGRRRMRRNRVGA
jgi:hypothetical protein